MPIAVGEKAPDFKLPDQNKNEVTLESLKGQAAVLAFYPLDFSPVCSKEHACFVDDLKQFQGLGARVLGISIDSPFSHAAFAEKMKISYPLLADFHPKGEVAKKFGLYLEEKGITNRATVILDKEGVVRYVQVYDVPQQRNNKEIVEALKKLA